MYDGYLSINGVEILNAARSAAYIKALAPLLQVKCDPATLAEALGHSEYTTPADDGAPWFRGQRLAAGGFLGLMPGKVQGAEDSTRKVPATELAGDGAIHTMARHTSRDIRFVATAIALNEEAMNEGLAWLKDVMAGEGCGEDVGLGCVGRDITMYAALPPSLVEARTLIRNFYRVEVSEAPRVTARLKSKSVLMWTVEFTLNAGVPWAFTALSQVAALNMDTGLSHTDPVGQDCSEALMAYDNFIADPFYTAISKPPRPPAILPPNILDIQSWRRVTADIPGSVTSRWGRVVPVARVVTANAAAQFVRLRFYRQEADQSSCNWDGEFLVSYIPANATLNLDGVRREVSVTLADGRVVPGGHLVFGSDGRPFEWPSMGCQNAYSIVADIMPGQPGVVVLVDAAVRE